MSVITSPEKERLRGSNSLEEEFRALNKQARQLATGIEVQLEGVGRRVREGRVNEEEGGREEVKVGWREVQLKMEQFKAYTEAMEELCSEVGQVTDPTFLPTLHRHREKYSQFQREANQLESKLQAITSRHELFGGPTSGSHRGDRSDLTEQSEAAYFLSEQSRLDSSHSMIDTTLGQAFELRNELHQQGHSLAGSNSRILNLTNSLPGISGLLNRINLRRRRDSVVLGGVIAVGIVFLYFTSF